jgi:hypothetical protein
MSKGTPFEKAQAGKYLPGNLTLEDGDGLDLEGYDDIQDFFKLPAHQERPIFARRQDMAEQPHGKPAGHKHGTL